MSEFPDILCINCEDMINYDQILPHSVVCLKPTGQVIKLISSNSNYRIQYRINKLKSALEAIFYSSTFEITELQRLHIEFLIFKANELTVLTKPCIESIDRATDLSSCLRTLCDSISPSLLVYSERLRSLALEKTYYFLDYLRTTEGTKAIKNFLLVKNQELNLVKRKIFAFSEKSLELQDLVKSYEEISGSNLFK
jgi:hypothetical protein